MKKVIVFVIIIVFVIAISGILVFNMTKPQDGYVYKLEDGFVPDAETAIKIAEAVWYPIYGDLTEEQPFIATYIEKDNAWYVRGSMPENTTTVGGMAEILIRKSDGKVIFIRHTM